MKPPSCNKRKERRSEEKHSRPTPLHRREQIPARATLPATKEEKICRLWTCNAELVAAEQGAQRADSAHQPTNKRLLCDSKSTRRDHHSYHAPIATPSRSNLAAESTPTRAMRESAGSRNHSHARSRPRATRRPQCRRVAFRLQTERARRRSAAITSAALRRGCGCTPLGKYSKTAWMRLAHVGITWAAARINSVGSAGRGGGGRAGQAQNLRVVSNSATEAFAKSACNRLEAQFHRFHLN